MKNTTSGALSPCSSLNDLTVLKPQNVQQVTKSLQLLQIRTCRVFVEFTPCSVLERFLRHSLSIWCYSHCIAGTLATQQWLTFLELQKN